MSDYTSAVYAVVVCLSACQVVAICLTTIIKKYVCVYVCMYICMSITLSICPSHAGVVCQNG